MDKISDLKKIIIKTLDINKAQDIVSIDLKDKSSMADYMIIASGTSSRHIQSLSEQVLDKLIEFKPEFLIFSMGFDANIADPLAQFELQSKDFYEITKRTLKATNEFTEGKVISVLEGGYDLNALAESAFNHVNALTENKK